MSLQFHDTSVSNRYDEDKDRGFENAVRNGQVRLAMDYAHMIIKELKGKVLQLEQKLSLYVPQPETNKEEAESEEPRKAPRARKAAAEDTPTEA